MKRILSILLCIGLGASLLYASDQTVTKTADTNDGVCDADCSLREAIAATGNGDFILFSPLFNSAQTITLTGTELAVTQSIIISGPGADKLTISGDNLSRVFSFTGSGNTMSMSGVRVTGGSVGAPSCLGGGIFVQDAFLFLDAVEVTGNSASTAAGGPCKGGGIYNLGFVFLSNSAITDNTAASASATGGGIQNGELITLASLIVTSSTISGNSATMTGGGVSCARSATFQNSTISNNNSAGIAGVNNGFLSSPEVSNTIIAKNEGDRDVFGNFISSGFNLIGNGGAATGLTQLTDQVGSTGAEIDPRLGPLGNNGGTTRTHRLLPLSPAVDMGNCFGATLDQRGFLRPVEFPQVVNPTGGDGCDIGATESPFLTAANVSISGRVILSPEAGRTSSTVVLTDSSGNSRTALTNPFGFYQFDDVTAGATYMISVSAKRHRFDPRIVVVNGDIIDLDFGTPLRAAGRK
jgi:CSLREA domain-containing protein